SAQYQTVADLVEDAEHHQQAGPEIGGLDRFVGLGIGDNLTRLVDRQQIAFFQTFARALAENNDVHEANLRHTALHREQLATDVLLRRAGEEVSGEAALLLGQQAVAAADFLGGTVQRQRGDIFLARQQLRQPDVDGVDAEHLAAIGIDEGLALAEDAVGGGGRVEGPAAINLVTGAADDVSFLA